MTRQFDAKARVGLDLLSRNDLLRSSRRNRA